MQVLMSVMNSTNPRDFVKEANIRSGYVIVNQITNDDIEPFNYNNKNKRIISVLDKGLSKSRNLAIKSAKEEIVLLSDDDMYYVDDCEKIVEEAFEKYPKADIIAFVVEHENKAHEKSILKEGKVGKIKSLKISSVQIAMRKNIILEKNICFDENFGAGTDLFMGEENIFLIDCIKKNLNIYYVPKKIGVLKVKHPSGWFKGYNKQFFNVKGANFFRMDKNLYKILILQFAIRKYKLYKKDISFFEAIKYMLEGKKNIL